jgi:hypothetical protein
MRTETLIDVSKVLAKLRQERERIDESIVSLERRAGRRRGRPPANRSVSGSASGGSGSSGAPLPSHPRPRLEDSPTRRRRTPLSRSVID